MLLSEFYRKKRPAKFEESNLAPSMVEPVYNPSISDILKNPNCLLHQYQPLYDDGDKLEDIEDNFNNDIQNTYGDFLDPDEFDADERREDKDKEEVPKNSPESADENQPSEES